ncbi:MAG: hypothetical protein RLZZ148_2252 [Cyanobacteriota bacterium]
MKLSTNIPDALYQQIEILANNGISCPNILLDD